MFETRRQRNGYDVDWRALARDHVRDGLQNDAGVERQRPVVDVRHVQAHPGFKIDGIAAIERPETSEPGTHAQPAALPALVPLHFAWNRRTRTHQRHVAAKHIEKLGQLVQRKPAQKPADRGQPRIVGNLGHHVFRIEMRDLVHPFFRIDDHGAEFVEGEIPSVQPAADLSENHRPPGRELHQNGNEQKYRTEHDQTERCEPYVGDPLDQQQNLVVGSGGKGEQRRGSDAFEGDLLFTCGKKSTATRLVTPSSSHERNTSSSEGSRSDSTAK